MNEIYETAKFWKSWGIATIPIAYGSKQPKVKWLPYTEQLPTDSELQNWYGNTQSNIAIVTGWQDLCILDFDDEEKLMTWRIWVDDEARVHHNMLPIMIYKNTRIHHTSRGYHVFVFCKGAENMKLPKLDILANRKYALLPPSLHPCGAQYEVYQNWLPIRINSLYDILPRKLLDAAYAAKAPKKVSSTQTVNNPPIPSNQPLVNNDDDMWDVIGTEYQSSPVVAEIKKRFHVEDYFPTAIDSGGNGRWKLTLCPFHEDHNPSFWIDTKEQICGCHSGCTPLPLDVIGLYARLHNVDNTTAIKEMAKHL